jgi:hypothetical protein
LRSLVVLAALIFAASSAVAGQPAAFCAAAKKPVDADPRLAAAVAAAFGKVMFNAAGEDCLYPLQVLPYATAEVLIVQAGEPGQACHGCGAPLSAHVLRRVDDSFRIVRRYPKFATLGTFGAVGNISAVEIGGDDGMAIESGGMFQGYSFSKPPSSSTTRSRPPEQRAPSALSGACREPCSFSPTATFRRKFSKSGAEAEA